MMRLDASFRNGFLLFFKEDYMKEEMNQAVCKALLDRLDNETIVKLFHDLKSTSKQ